MLSWNHYNKLHEFTDQGHFGGDYYKEEFPELVDIIKKKL